MQIKEFIEKLRPLYRKDPKLFGIIMRSRIIGAFYVVAKDILKGEPLRRIHKKYLAKGFLISEAVSIVVDLESRSEELKMLEREKIEELKRIVEKYLTEEDIYEIYKGIAEVLK